MKNLRDLLSSENSVACLIYLVLFASGFAVTSIAGALVAPSVEYAPDPQPCSPERAETVKSVLIEKKPVGVKAVDQ